MQQVISKTIYGTKEYYNCSNKLNKISEYDHKKYISLRGGGSKVMQPIKLNDD